MMRPDCDGRDASSTTIDDDAEVTVQNTKARPLLLRVCSQPEPYLLGRRPDLLDAFAASIFERELVESEQFSLPLDVACTDCEVEEFGAVAFPIAASGYSLLSIDGTLEAEIRNQIEADIVSFVLVNLYDTLMWITEAITDIAGVAIPLDCLVSFALELTGERAIQFIERAIEGTITPFSIIEIYVDSFVELVTEHWPTLAAECAYDAACEFIGATAGTTVVPVLGTAVGGYAMEVLCDIVGLMMFGGVEFLATEYDVVTTNNYVRQPFPLSDELCGDTPVCLDEDEDGYTTCDGDCDDLDEGSGCRWDHATLTSSTATGVT